VGGVRHPQHTQTGSNSSTIAAGRSNGVTNRDAVDTVVCASDDGWKYHPKYAEQFPNINKVCNVVSCWIYTYIGIYLGYTDPQTLNLSYNTSKWQMGFTSTFKGLMRRRMHTYIQFNCC
jgi:hypothetical protein